MAELPRRSFLAASGATLWTAAGSGVPVPAASARLVDDLDPVALAAEMIRLDTSHLGQGGNTLPYAKLLEALFVAAGVPTEIVPTPTPDNVHVIARVRGSGAHRPLMLMGHSDVVVADPERWSVPPYAGQTRDGFLYGRGALDMKGANAAFAVALLRHVRAGARFDRDIIYLGDCDEEGGAYGGAWLAANHWDKVDAGTIITEGGWLLAQPDGRTPMLASATCADRAGITLRLVGEAPATHAGHPPPQQAVLRLARGLTHLAGYRPHTVPNALSLGYFRELGDRTGNPRLAAASRALLRARTQRERDLAGDAIVRNSDYPWLHHALLRVTFSYFGLAAGQWRSILPATADADVRVSFMPGGEDPVSALADIRRHVEAAGVRTQLIGGEGQSEAEVLADLQQRLSVPVTPADTDVFHAWRDAVTGTYPGCGAVAAQFESATSANPWRLRGIPAYGVYPYLVDNDTMMRMHGADERVGTAALRQGTEVMYRLLARLRIS